MVKFRGVFREGSKVLPWEALFFQIFVIFGYPGDPEGLNFLLKMHFLEALQFHDFGVRFGGVFDAFLMDFGGRFGERFACIFGALLVHLYHIFSGWFSVLGSATPPDWVSQIFKSCAEGEATLFLSVK